MDIYFEDDYGKLYEIVEGGTSEIFEFEGEYGVVKHSFIKRKIPDLVSGETYYDLTTPYGYGGPVILSVNGGFRDKLVNEFEIAFDEYCRKNNIVSEFVRFHPIEKNYLDFKNMYSAVPIRETVGTMLNGESVIEREFSKHCRKRINKALRDGISYKITEKPESLQDFKQFYYSTMDRNNATDFYYFDDEYFNNCIKYFRNNIILVEAIFEGRTIAAGFYFVWEKVIHIHLSGTLTEFLYLSPAYILRYAVTLWGIENNYEIIHHGGGRTNSEDDGLFKFKKQFGIKTSFDFYVGKKIWNDGVYKALCYENRDSKSKFFPLYRLVRKDVLIVAHFTQDPSEDGNGRFHYIANELANDEEYKVEVVTSSFSHRKKVQRNLDEKDLEKLNYRFTMVEEPGYKKNVSLKRFSSHFQMSKSLKGYLAKRKKPDIVYCAIPSIDVAYTVAKYTNEKKIKLIVDIQDLWPEAFQMVFKMPIISSFVFLPMIKRVNYAYSKADEIVAVSKTYAERAKTVNFKCEEVHSVFLGTDLTYFDSLAKEPKKIDQITLVYIGTLGHSYDLTAILNAIQLLYSWGYKVKFLVMGDGPLMNKFIELAMNLQLDVEFAGSLPYEKMVFRLCGCDIAINPIAHGAAQSIINKVGDYAAAGLPVISTQECPEYKALLAESESGLTCKNGDVNDIALKIKYLIDNDMVREKMSFNSRKLAEKKFDRCLTYKEIINLL